MQKKYRYLKNSENLFQNLLERAKLVEDIKILNHGEKSWVKWSEIELTYLVHGYSESATKRKDFLDNNRNIFHQSRTNNTLKRAYYYLKKNPNRFIYFQQKAKLLK